MADKNKPESETPSSKRQQDILKALEEASKYAAQNADTSSKISDLMQSLTTSEINKNKKQEILKQLKKEEKKERKKVEVEKAATRVRNQLLRRIADTTLKISVGNSSLLSFWHQSGNIFFDVIQNVIGNMIKRIEEEITANTEVTRKGMTIGMKYQDAIQTLQKDQIAFSRLNAKERQELEQQFLHAGFLGGDAPGTKFIAGLLKIYKQNSEKAIELARLTRDTLNKNDRGNSKLLSHLIDLGYSSNLGTDRMVSLMSKIVPSTQHLDLVLSQQDRDNLHDAIAEFAAKSGIEADKIANLANSFLTNVQTGLVANVSPDELVGKNTHQMVGILERLNRNLTTFQKDLTPKSITGAILSTPIINKLAGTDVTGTLRARERIERTELKPVRDVIKDLDKRSVFLDPGRIGNAVGSKVGQFIATQTRVLSDHLTGIKDSIDSANASNSYNDRLNYARRVSREEK